MFDKKQDSLFEKKQTAGDSSTMNVSTNPFVVEGIKAASQTKSGNGALKYTTTGSDFVDQFGKGGTYKTPRDFKDVSNDMQKIWNKNPYLAVCLTLYFRMITRVITFFNGSKTKNPQRGVGLQHEGIFRAMWIAIYYPDVYWKNFELFISVGSWKDVITMLSYDLQYNGWKDKKLNWVNFGKVILAGLENPNTSELVKKYIPRIYANSHCKTLEAQADNIIAKWLCSLLFGTQDHHDQLTKASDYKKYRRLKSSGTAHSWQKLISKGSFLSIDFDKIHGRALAKLVSSKFLKNNKLEQKYSEWISSKPVAKYTGFVHELVVNKNLSNLTPYQVLTINAQFNQIVETARKGISMQNIRPISVLDASGSMSSPMYGGKEVLKYSSMEVAFSSLIFFNELLPNNSPFKDYYLSFSNETRMHKLTGATFTDKYFKSRKEGYGGTNFESIFIFFAKFKANNPHVPECLIPNFIICFSDGEFNNVGSKITKTTNVALGRIVLQHAGYSKEFCDSFGICFVDLPNTFYSRKPQPKFETFANEKNVFYFSGFDLSPLSFLFGVEGRSKDSIPTTAEEFFKAAMDQEIFEKVEI